MPPPPAPGRSAMPGRSPMPGRLPGAGSWLGRLATPGRVWPPLGGRRFKVCPPDGRCGLKVWPPDGPKLGRAPPPPEKLGRCAGMEGRCAGMEGRCAGRLNEGVAGRAPPPPPGRPPPPPGRPPPPPPRGPRDDTSGGSISKAPRAAIRIDRIMAEPPEGYLAALRTNFTSASATGWPSTSRSMDRQMNVFWSTNS